MPLDPRLRCQLYDADLSSPTLLETFTEEVQNLVFTTAQHGGFRTCTFDLTISLSDAWAYFHEILNSGNFGAKGRHFNRIVIEEQIGTTIGTFASNIVWEGRIMWAELVITPQGQGVSVLALGYYSSLRDQLYSATDHTDWTTGGPHTTDDIIKEMLTQVCPDINSDQAGIDAPSRDVVGLDLTARGYTQDFIVKQLAPIADSDDSTWFFSIWEERKPYWTKRAISFPDYSVWLRGKGSGIQELKLAQDALNLRNAIIPVDNGTEGTTATLAASLTTYPRRELLLTVPTGSSANVEADAAQTAANERGKPQQTQSFVVGGSIFHAPVSGAIIDIPKWRVRAGKTIRVQDLVPASASSAFLDAVRTFFIMETSYNAETDTLSVQPDTYRRSLSGIVGRLGDVEKSR